MMKTNTLYINYYTCIYMFFYFYIYIFKGRFAPLNKRSLPFSGGDFTPPKKLFIYILI